MRTTLFTLLFSLPFTTLAAQTDDQYLMEMGGGIGLLGYLGDYNNNLTRCLQPMFALSMRRNFNPYTAIEWGAGIGQLKGKARQATTYTPTMGRYPARFSHTLVDAHATFEYHFWPYGTGHDYYHAQRFTPYLFAGVGATYVNGTQKKVFTANIPLGIGVKYKINKRVNAALSWAIHFATSDKLDGIKDPVGIPSSGLWKNADAYSMLQFALTYSFKAKCATCNKD